MPRSVNAVASRQRKKRILNAAKGYFGARSKVYTVAKNAVDKALGYAYRDRRNKKRAFRRLWIARINAGARLNDTTYSRLIHAMQENNIQLNRKVLADLAVNDAAAFAAIVKAVSK